MDQDSQAANNNPIVPAAPTPVPPGLPGSTAPLPPTPVVETKPADLVKTAQPKVIISSGSHRKAFVLGALAVFFLIGLVVSVYLVQRQQSQSLQSKAVSSGKAGCNGGTTDVNCPGCAGCMGMPSACTGTNCTGSVTIPGMPDTMDAWGVVNPTYNQSVTCTSRNSQKADCSCQVPNSGSYCWMGLESLVLNGSNQGHRWAMYIYDKTTNQLKSGGPTTWVLYDDNPSGSSMWGNSTFFATGSVLNCGERHEYREQADLSSPGSWGETGQVIYAEPTGCNASPPVTASCQMVSADKDLTKVKIGDTVKFTGYGSVSSDTDKIDKIAFILTKDGTPGPDSAVDAIRAPDKDSGNTKFYVATQSAQISAVGSYSMRIKVHWLHADNTSEWKE